MPICQVKGDFGKGEPEMAQSIEGQVREPVVVVGFVESLQRQELAVTRQFEQ